MMSGILDAFLDGFIGAGLYERARLPGPPTSYRQAMIALSCGSIASLAVIVGFTYLVVHDHPKMAYVLISALVAGGIVRIVRTVRHRRGQKVAPVTGPADIQQTQDQGKKQHKAAPQPQARGPGARSPAVDSR